MCSKVHGYHQIDVVEICEAGLRCYHDAVRAGTLEPRRATPCLIQLGLVRPGPAGALVPVPPTTAAALLVEPLRQEIAHRQGAIVALEPSIAAATDAYWAAQRGKSGDLSSIRGAETISAALRLAVDSATEELLTVQPGGRRPPELLRRALEGEARALRRGVRQRTIYQHAIRSHAPTVDYIRKVVAAGAEVRTVDEVVDRLIIVDRSVAFVPVGVPRAEEALEIRNSALVRFLVGVFESAWRRAWPVATGPAQLRPPHVLDEIQMAIVRFLVRGYTEIKIARQLGLSQRTVAAHVRKISDRLGSSSRTQLGYLIAVSNLVAADQVLGR